MTTKINIDMSWYNSNIDPLGYHMMGCKIGTNAIRLHDEVVFLLARLFRTSRVDAIVEPLRLFTGAGANIGFQTQSHSS